MRYIRYLVLAIIVIVLVSVSLANRELVTLKLVPEGLVPLVGTNWQIDLPLFLVVLGGVVVGLVIGFLWEWLREHKHRRQASRADREVRQLKTEVSKLKTDRHEGRDDVLAILDQR